MERKVNNSSTSLTNNNKKNEKSIQLDTVVNVTTPEIDELPDSSGDEVEDNVDKDYCTCIYNRRLEIKRVFAKHGRKIKAFVSVFLMCLYIAYFSYAMYLHHADSRTTSLIVITATLSMVIFAKCVPYQSSFMKFQKLMTEHPRIVTNFKRSIAASIVLIACITLVTEVILVRPSNLISLAGIAGIISVFFITSTHPHKIKWRPVLSGLILQYFFALCILKVPAVYSIFQWGGEMMRTFLSFAKDGEIFLYGEDSILPGLVFRVVPLIAFVLCVLTVLEHLMVLHAILRILGRFLSICIGVSPAEALNASANIFLGPVDSLMIIRPFLEDVTPSELHCLMANGMSTVTGSVMGIYVLLGISADHLLAASVMSAPAALSLSKLAVPETQIYTNTKTKEVKFVSKYQSVMDAASSGAIAAMSLCAAVIANITAVVSVMKMLNYFLNWLGELVDFKGLTLQWICSYIFYPLALGLGVDVQDGRRVAELIGVKVFINEIVAYTTLGEYKRNRVKFEEYTALNYTDWSSSSDTYDITLPGWNMTLVRGYVTERTEVITTYALCGFANFICVGVMMGCYLVLVPHRKEVVFKYIMRSMVVGHCASFVTACVAGVLRGSLGLYVSPDPIYFLYPPKVMLITHVDNNNIYIRLGAIMTTTQVYCIRDTLHTDERDCLHLSVGLFNITKKDDTRKYRIQSKGTECK